MNWVATTVRLLFSMALLTLCLGLNGCANRIPEIVHQSPIPHIDTNLFGERPDDILSAEEIFSLSEPQKKIFYTYFNNPKYRHKGAHTRIARYVEKLLDDFNYTIETNTANNSLVSSSGDCMSLATITTAFAKEVGVNISYRTINNTPFFDQRGDFVVRSNHVRSVLFKPMLYNPNHAFVNFTPSVTIDFYPQPGDVAGKRIMPRQFLGMFYRNLAAKEMVKKNYDRAFWLAFEAVKQAPYDHENINLMAVIHRRTEHNEKAEQLYKYGIEHAISKVPLLRNYRILLRLQNRLPEADQISATLAAIEDTNPFYWIDLANEHYRTTEYDLALFYFRKAIKTAPYLHHGYQGLASTYFQLDNQRKAEAALEKAMENSPNETVRTRFEGKLAVLRNGI